MILWLFRADNNIICMLFICHHFSLGGKRRTTKRYKRKLRSNFRSGIVFVLFSFTTNNIFFKLNIFKHFFIKKLYLGPNMDRQNSFTKVFIFAKIFAKKTCVCVVVDNDDNDYAMQHGVHIHKADTKLSCLHSLWLLWNRAKIGVDYA